MFTALPDPTRGARIGNVRLGPPPVKVLASLVQSTPEALTAALLRFSSSPVDIFEWRVDYLAKTDRTSINTTARSIKSVTDKPILATVRTQFEGGLFGANESAYETVLASLIASGSIDALDIEVERTCAARIARTAHANAIPVIASYHNFELTPEPKELMARFYAMQTIGADVFKVAVMPRSPEDVLHFMQIIMNARRTFAEPIIAMSMSNAGRITRTAGALFGSCASFGALESTSAPGQIPVRPLRDMLHIFSL